MRSLPEASGLRPEGGLSFGPDYARTLHEWYLRFNARWPEIEAMGFDTRFRRMWNLYLASCAGAFQRGNCDVTQFVYVRPRE
jgi:cyclopropane-fatty-acyl-phospholipid synthase